jgi:hypothetical protein
MAILNATTCPAVTTLLESIDQVATWLPFREPLRKGLLAGVKEIQCQSQGRALSRGFFRSFQVDVLRLQKGPLRSILVRRVEELDRLYRAS